MKFFENDDYNSLRGMTIVGIVAVFIALIIGYFNHLSDIHDERMAQMGCSQKLINNYHLWECGKDKQ